MAVAPMEETMSTWRVTALFAFLLLPFLATAKDLDRDRLNPVLGSILKVEVVTTSGGYSLGTAVSIAPGKFVTSCHVTARAEKIALLAEGSRWPAVGEMSNTEYDLCVLNVPSLAHIAPVHLRSARELRVGQAVAALGYTFGAGLAGQSGSIRALHPLNGSLVIQSTTPFNSGASGGGLFDENGALVGILTFRLPGAEAYYFSMPIDWISDSIDKADAYGEIAPLQGPRPFWAHPIESLPYFMRATSLEANQDWESLIKLTEQWALADEKNAEPWFMRGTAYSRIDRNDASIKAYRTALERDPKFALAWFNLGEAYFRRGDRSEVARVLAELKPLDPDLADDLAVKSGTAR